jgi:hypothetical protein
MPDETLIDLITRYPDPPPEPVDRPLPWAGALESSVFDPTWERDAKRALGLLVPTTPREVATELLMGAAAGPMGAAVSKVGGPVVRAIRRVVNPPFDPTKRQSLGSMLGKDTLENIQRRKLLATGVDRSGVALPHLMINRGVTERLPSQEWIVGGDEWIRLLKEAQNAQDILSYTLDTQSKKPGILGDLIEHGNILARKIREEALEETGGAITEEASDPAIKAVVDSLLRRLGVPRGKR